MVAPPCLPPGCDFQLEPDGGADTMVAPVVDHVVAAADLHVLADGTFAAAVELWGAGSWRAGVVWTGGRAPLLWDLGPPPPGMTPPLAEPRFALSEAEEPAVALRTPAPAGGWELRLGTASAAPQVVAPVAGLEHVAAWAGPTTPAVVWLTADRTGIESSLGPVATRRFEDMAALARPGGGVLVAGAAANRLAIWTLAADGSVATVIDRALDAYLPKTLHAVQGAEKFYYVGYVVRVEREQAYTLVAATGALPRPVGVPTVEPLDAIVNGFGTTWLVAPTDDAGGHGLGVMLQASSPMPFPIARDGPDEALAVEPLAVIGQGVVALALRRAGMLAIDVYAMGLVCR